MIFGFESRAKSNDPPRLRRTIVYYRLLCKLHSSSQYAKRVRNGYRAVSIHIGGARIDARSSQQPHRNAKRHKRVRNVHGAVSIRIARYRRGNFALKERAHVEPALAALRVAVVHGVLLEHIHYLIGRKLGIVGLHHRAAGCGVRGGETAAASGVESKSLRAALIRFGLPVTP